jgi:hypothetical protein
MILESVSSNCRQAETTAELGALLPAPRPRLQRRIVKPRFAVAGLAALLFAYFIARCRPARLVLRPQRT